MPKSKRNKVITLARTDKQGYQAKTALVEEIKECVDEYANIFLFSVQNMRNTKLKDVRSKWRESRFFFGRNKVMIHAFGRSAEEEYKDGIHELSDYITGNVGILFTNREKDDVVGWFEKYGEADFARSGDKASETVTLSAGPLPQFPHSIEPHLRKLGLATSLQRGVVMLLKDTVVCTKGAALSPSEANILKLLGITMAEFHVTLTHAYNEADGVSFLQGGGGGAASA